MTQLFPEGNFNSREDTLLKNTTERHPLNFIGPHDATNEARGLLESQAQDLAKIAVMNFPLYDDYRTKVVALAKEAMAKGMLRLNSESKTMNADEQVEQFISTTIMAAYETHDEVVATLKMEKEQMRLGSSGPDKELQEELNATRELVAKQAKRILSIRSMLVERGASEEFMRDFDYTTKLMSRPEHEAYEHEKELTPEAEFAPLMNTEEVRIHRTFRDILATTFSRESLQRVGILAPHSGEVTIIRQEEKSF